MLACAGCSSRDSSHEETKPAATASPPGTAGALPAGAEAWSVVPRGTPPLNLILITLDTTRRDRLSCYGYPKKTTPNLDDLAADGILFEEAFTPVPITLPSHATILTGLYPFQHGARHNGSYVLSDSLTTLAEMLRSKGYRTGAVLAAFPVDRRFGLAQGFDDYEDRIPALSGSGGGETVERRAPEVTRLALAYLDRQGERPFFLWVHYFDPHASYRPPEPFASRFYGDPYAGEIAAMDASIGDLLKGLESRGLRDRTVLLVAGDHGEGLGDHGEPTHTLLIYGATQKVPLLAWFPRAGTWAGDPWRGRRVRGAVGLIDLLPTAWNALGFERGELPPIAGRSLLPLVEGAAHGHDWLYHETLAPELDYGMGELRGLQIGSWKYIRGTQPELFDLDRDPGEIENLADREGERVRTMEAGLAKILEAERPAHALGDISEETIEKLRALGYMQGGPPPSRVARDDAGDKSGLGKETARAQSLAEAGRVEEAVALLDSILGAHPETHMALRLRAAYLAQLARGTESLEAYEKALADCRGCPSEFRLLQEQAGALLAVGRTEEALRRVRVLLEARPEEQGLHILLGQAHEKLGDAAAARDAYEREASLFPHHPEASVRLGGLFASQGRAADAERAYRKAIENDPGSVDALVLLSELLGRSGRKGEAEELADRALALRPESPAAHHRKAWLLREAGRKAEALPHFEAAARGQPGNAIVQYELGSLYGELGRNEEARFCYEKAVRSEAAPSGAYANLAVLAAQAGRYPEAIRLWNQALERKPTPREAGIIRANIRKAEELMSGPGAKTR
jgi:arylsulfatase A-like enzyme/tetratricopeptide (TPR) repeat protein